MSGDESIAATLGGPGWGQRTQSHRADIIAGDPWHACSVSSEVAPLKEVMLAWPPDSIRKVSDPRANLLFALPDLDGMRRETIALKSRFEERGIIVHLLIDCVAPPNIVFTRDTFFMTPEGAIIARPAATQRARESRIISGFLAQLGIPILASICGTGTFEGADALWIDEKTVVVGIGRRTNEEGAAQIRRVLKGIGVDVYFVSLPRGVQHLLGVVNPISASAAAYNASAPSEEVERYFAQRGVSLLPVPSVVDETDRRVHNFVALAPGVVLAPAGAGEAFERFGLTNLEVIECDVAEHLKCAGGIGCMTGVLSRSA